VTLPILAELISRGDGTYVLKPQAVPTSLDTWITPKRAAQIIGIEGRSIYKLLDPGNPFLVCKRPLKGKCLVSLRSVMTFVQATSDPDFWNDALQQQTLKQAVRQAMDTLRGIGTKAGIATSAA
jgi:hypothetical protein